MEEVIKTDQAGVESGQSGTAVVPAGAWDCHMHVFGPFDRFPLPMAGAYAPPVADRKKNARLLEALGFDHALLIQPSAYGEDHAALLDALEHGGGRLLGIGSCSGETSAEELARLRARGIVGLRFVGVRGPGGGAYPGTQDLDALRLLAPIMAKTGMHAQIWANPADCAAIARMLADEGVPVAFDHLAVLDPEDGPGTKRLDEVLGALDAGNAWIKLTWFRRSRRPGNYDDVRETVSTIAQAAPDRILWGSDWPFVRSEMPPEPQSLLQQLRGWIGEEAFRRCLADNPRALLAPALT